jgi:hypothetical protein
MEDLFNLTTDDLITEEPKSKNLGLYKPSADKGKEGVYSAVIRFIPWHKEPKKSRMKKWTCWLKDPLSGNGKYIDCPSTINEKSKLQDMYFKLKKSDSVADKELADNFSRRQKITSLIQVIQDKNNPELEGKILIWSYGVKINNKIQEVLEPEYGEPQNPFNLNTGKAFMLKISKVSGYNNYDSCKFLDQIQPIMIDGEPVLADSAENKTRILEFLQEESPDLSSYDYQPWTEETHEYVNSVILNTVPDANVVSDIIGKDVMAKAMASSPAVVEDPLQDTSDDDVDSLLNEINNDDEDDLYAGL